MALKRKSNPASSEDSLAKSDFEFANLDSIKIYIVDAKLDDYIVYELRSIVETSGCLLDKHSRPISLQLCAQVEDADVIVTAVRMKQRLERHISWNLAKSKAIVIPDWLRDSVHQRRPLPCSDYVAVHQLHDTTVENCPNDDCDGTYPDSINIPTSIESSKTLCYNARLCCQRSTPLVCPNEDLVQQLAVLRLHRELEGFEINALSYERAIAVIKAYPHKINDRNFQQEVINLPHVGEKLASKIEEYLKRGYITERNDILSSVRFNTLSLFTSIYGIGSSTARKLYSMGLRTIQDLERYYNLPPKFDVSKVQELNVESAVQSKLDMPLISIQIGLALRNDLAEKIPRAEVEEIQRIVKEHLDNIHAGCLVTITGGYRRGKSQSNDVDIVITHPKLKSGGDEIKGLCKKLVRQLHQHGLVTHVMHLSSFRPPNAIRMSRWDTLEKALTVFVLPTDDTRTKRVYRRLDLIFAAPEAYWSAVVGWTGSKMFQRDLRLWAKEHGMKFDSSGITRLHDSKLLYPQSECEVFKYLGLEWVDPIMRNADA